MENTPYLETGRLILRKFTENDMDALFRIFSDKEVNTFLPWQPLESLAEAAVYYKKNYADAYVQDLGYKYAICLKTGNVPIGYVNVSMGESHDLGYGLRKEFWHRGIVTEAARAVLMQVKSDGILFVTATHDVKNPRSGGVMKQLGMQYKYSYEELWQPKNFCVTFRMYQINFDGTKRVYMEYWNTSDVHFVETEL